MFGTFDDEQVTGAFSMYGDPIMDSLCDLSHKKISEIKYSAKVLLNETDWYITRQAEGIKDAPTEIIEARKKIRDEADAEIKEINKLSKKADIVGFKSELR